MRNHCYENDFDLHENETACRTHFHMKGFAFRLVLKQRHKRTRKWPIWGEYQWGRNCYVTHLVAMVTVDGSLKPWVGSRRWTCALSVTADNKVLLSKWPVVSALPWCWAGFCLFCVIVPSHREPSDCSTGVLTFSNWLFRIGFVTFSEVIPFVTFLECGFMTFSQQNGEAWNNLSNVYIKTGQK